MAFGELYILDDNACPIREPDTLKWARWLETKDKSLESQINGIRVSTVFLAIDNACKGETIPVLWQSMIFGGSYNGWQKNYTSASTARAGHELACLIAEGKTTPEVIEEMEGILQ